MTMNNHTWEEETRKTLTLIQTELHDAERELGEAQAKVDRLTKEAEAMELALQIHLQRTGKRQVIEKDMRKLLISQRNHEERIKRIAEQNNGVLKVALATDILYNYHLLKSRTRINAYRIIYGLLLRMTGEGIFKKTAPGEFRLMDMQTRLSSIS
jgi:hypothetical protein